MEDGAEAVADVETAAAEPESPSEPVASEAETPSPDAAAEPAPEAGSDEDDLARLAKSRGLNLSTREGRAALAQFFGKTMSDAARFAKEIETLKARPATPEPPQAPPETPADVKELDAHITALKTDVGSFPKREAALFQKYDEVRLEIAGLNRELKYADELDKPSKQAEIRRYEQFQAQLEAQLEALPREKRLLEIELRRAENDRKGLQSTHEDLERARQQAGEERQRFNVDFPAKVDNWLKQAADELKVPSHGDYRSILAEEVRDGLMARFSAMAHQGVEFNEAEIPGLVRGLVERWLKKNDLISRAKLQQSSVGKTPVAPGQRSTTAARPTPKPESAFPTDEELEAEAAERRARLEKALAR